jgi:hypothetical protein
MLGSSKLRRQNESIISVEQYIKWEAIRDQNHKKRGIRKEKVMAKRDKRRNEK